VSINFGTYRILYQTECTKRRDKLRCGELGRSIVINKGKDIKTISNHLGWLADFKYIADIQSLRSKNKTPKKLLRSEGFKHYTQPFLLGLDDRLIAA